MKRVLAVLTFILLSAMAAQEQEHAPTLDVCRADEAVWGNVDAQNDYYSAKDGEEKNNTAMGRLSLKEIDARLKELSDCAQVDSDRKHSYSFTAQFYADLQSDRWIDFIIRHHLLEQMEREDAAGER